MCWNRADRCCTLRTSTDTAGYEKLTQLWINGPETGLVHHHAANAPKIQYF
jgi:hypothetical protein